MWVACESAQSRKARKFIRENWTRHHTLYRIVGYWHVDAEEQMRKWEALTDAQRDRYMEIWDESRPDEVNWEEPGAVPSGASVSNPLLAQMAAFAALRHC
ncbi:hypothetical protein [Demequina litorisediminis]|uniref:Uncharacterized protein n=1 Tax=Demequina litorisediminis TaxID=1849022 RepID=A0ABQ6ID90_9MICO|nr:hypothetical protein [Demequina litorisediminis]GMA34972.1 hypothetical protein GCM10025876_11760 [Demequina litorisediminis]